jgi:hypothetical protein
VFRNDLIELIQYEPATPTVYKRPLLIVPPWINKFYILDLNPEKSFIRWAVSQGLTVFTISWVNPDERQAKNSFEDYMREGIFAALDAIEKATGEKSVTAIGYCVGGTLLSVALSYMAAAGDKRIESATLFTTQVDFTHAGDLSVFVDEEQIRSIEDRMYARGYLEGSSMASAFNMLRPNDLIWPYVVNVYLKGESPFPFDLLFWNSDSTRMPAANHSFYLRQAPGPGQGEDPDLQPRGPRGPHRPCQIRLQGIEMLRRTRHLRSRRLWAHRRRRQPGVEAEVSVLDGRESRGNPRGVACGGNRDARHVVASLDGVDRRAVPGHGQGQKARQPQAQAAVRCSRRIREGPGVTS